MSDPEATPPTLVIFDLETTGTSTEADEIVEFAAQIGLGPDAETWTCRIRPGRPIPAAASAIHGIHDTDVATCERFPARADRIREIVTGADVLVGYNLAFDLELLDAELDRHGLPPLDLSRTLVVDAFALWRRVEPRTLSGAHARFVGAPFEGAHRAAEDVAATGRVLEGMLRAFGLAGEPWAAVAERAEPGRGRWIGHTGHIEWRAGVPVLTFGRHRGRALDAVAAEESGSYLRWILDGRFPPHVKRIARLALELDAHTLRRRLAAEYGAPPPPDGPRDEPEATTTEAAPRSDVTPAPPSRSAPDPTESTPAGPIIFFDGVCNLCNRWVRFVAARDRRARFRFASLESRAAARLLASHPGARETDSVVLLEDGRAYVKTAAALRILRALGGVWTLAGICRIVPRPLRDLAYDFFARHRYSWFGRREPGTPAAAEIRARTLDQG